MEGIFDLIPFFHLLVSETFLHSHVKKIYPALRPYQQVDLQK